LFQGELSNAKRYFLPMPSEMKNKFLHAIGPLVGLVIFSIALWVLYQALHNYHYHDIPRHLRELPLSYLLIALGLTMLNYLIMSGYDLLALRYINYRLRYPKIAIASFIGYAFSNNVGLSMLAGGSVRFRLYSAWGLSVEEITKVVIFCSLTLWLGFLTLGGIVFLFEPMVIPNVLQLPLFSVRPIGMIFIFLLGGYLSWNLFRKRPLKLRNWEFPLPSFRIFFAQIAVASLDWALAGTILYILLPSSAELSYFGFLSIYLLAQAAGLVSQVPGGLGVFETVILLLLTPYFPASAVFGSLLAYRGIYYLLPFAIATIMLGAHEVLDKRERVEGAIKIFGQWVPSMVPHVLSVATFIAGVILLFSGALPGVRDRLAWLKDFLPLPVIEISHFLGSLAGMGLLFLGRGIQRRLDAAYILTIILLGAGIVFSILKGFDFEEAIILSIMLGILIPSRRHFYRKASLFSQRFTPGWMIAIVLVVLCSIWIGFFSHKHVEYSGELWWRFTLFGSASRFLRATVGVTGGALFIALARLLHPAAPKMSFSRTHDLEKAGNIVENSKRTYAHLALLGDKEFLFSENENAFIMYGMEGRSWVALGDPVGPKGEWTELIWRFREMCDRYIGWAIFYEVGKENLNLYLDLGLSPLKLGEEALILLRDFSLEGRERKALRHSYHKIEKEACSFEIVSPSMVPQLLPELKSISDTWLKEKNVREKKFSIGFFNPDYLIHSQIGVVRKQGRILAFANLLQGVEKEELSIDLMRYLPEAPHGIMDYLFVELMLWGKNEGYQQFNLGMAPLSGLEDHALAPLWNRVGSYIFRHGEHFYNFQGLREYKEKYRPSWEPKYLASPGGLVLPRVLMNIASLISGGMKGVVSK
jgi:phosphatidylglycerol lysyltransferase